MRIVATMALLALFASSAPAATPSCDRTCLEKLLDGYLTALVAHDPKALPRAPGARFTENGQAIEPGDGLWGTIDSLSGYRLTFADPEAGQIGAFVTLKESGRDQLLGLRLKVTKGRISEGEMLIVRPKDGYVFGAPLDLKDKPIFRATLTPAQRRPRVELIRVANSYFEGLVHATETLTPFDETCQRIENGVVTANNPDPAPRMAMWKRGCHAQFATHFSQFITNIRERRFAVVDEQRGLVYALGFFDHAGRIKTQKLADGTVSPVPPDMQVPYSFQIGELFKISDGKIMRIEAVVIPVPYGMKSGRPN